MNEQDLQYFKNKLEENLARLTKDFQSMGRELNEKGDWVVVPEPSDKETPEFDEIADRIESFESDIAVLSVLEKDYTDTLDALNNIEQGTYGICKISGNPIERDRLEANPTANTCKAYMND